MSSISFGGLASGLDTEAIIEALMSTARRPINVEEDKKTSLDRKLGAYSTLSAHLSKVRTAASGMDTSGDFRALTAVSSDESIIESVASSSANPGTYVMTVNNLAQAERTYSDPFATKDTAGLFGAGTLTITDGSGTPVDVVIDGTDTLETVASKINDSDAAVNAAVVFDGTNYRLLVMAEDTGAANGVTFAEGGTLALDLDDPANEAQAAVDASVTMDGITFTNGSNQLTEMIPGVTLDLKNSSAQSVTVKVDLDLDAMSSKLEGLVSAYNGMASYLHGQFQYNGESRTDGLMGEAAARSVKSQLQDIIGDEVAGVSGAFSLLSQVGIDTETDGTLKFDSAAFKEAIASDPSSVIDLFAYDDGDADLAEDGVALRLVTTLDGLLQSPDGLLPAREDGLRDSISAAEERIEDLEYRLEGYEQMLRRQFASMEEAMAQYNSTGSFLSQQGF
jgi:flagellar hook-associated protein 2